MSDMSLVPSGEGFAASFKKPLGVFALNPNTFCHVARSEECV
jgi:hypothetical protein